MDVRLSTPAEEALRSRRSPTCSLDARLRCSRCKVRVYCSAKCQRGDWKEHRRTCQAPAAEPVGRHLEHKPGEGPGSPKPGSAKPSPDSPASDGPE